ncbi:MAG TPA: BamA/TamA family outer membrane protein [Chitinophagaceae bacterium]|nr:BamA/TamA family outer membrane protein [Chitinophagaceae bacterium]
MLISCKRLYYFGCLILITCSFFSCSVEKSTLVKNYPVDTPFVFNNNIVVKGNLTRDEKKRLSADLVNYWDDSLFAARSSQYGLSFKSNTPFFFTSKLINPPIYDSTNRIRTASFMNGYLKSQGYYYSFIKDSVARSYYEGQRRVSITDTVYTGKQMIIDTEKFAMATPRLQFLADSSKKASLIQPRKSPFGKNLVGTELDRLVALYRQKGFFLLTRDNLIAEADTLDQALLTFSADPFEQAQKISEAIERKKQNPTTVITVMQRENNDTTFQLLPDSAYFRPYYVGNIYYYPEADVRLIADSVMQDTASIKRLRSNAFTMYYQKGLFKLKTLTKITQIHSGRLYNENAFNRTMTNFNQLPAWSQVDYRTVLRNDSVDFYFFLSPARPQNITFSVEGSRNTGDFLSTGTLIGTAFNIGYTNRNFLFKRAHQFNATFSNGVEFTLDKNYPFLQTFLSSLNLAYSIPNVKLSKNKNVTGTLKFDATPNYSERNNFFRIRSLVTGAGLEWKRRNTVWQVRFPNIELYSLDTLPLLIEAFKENPFLRSSFNTGSVVSLQGAVSRTLPGTKNINNTFYFRGAAEWAPFGFISKNLYQFAKIEGEIRKQWQAGKTSTWATRFFAGVGLNYSNNSSFGTTMPFFKQFIAGGPNSMRAWALRQLGLGSSIASDTSTFRERYGDMQLEGNIEFRFNVMTVGSVKVGSALFADVGNIWNVKRNPALPGAEFDISRFGKDIAIGMGTGLRLDFNYFLIRLDFALKLKDPARAINSGWLNFRDFTWQDKEYGVGINNYALQLGIGLPF